MGRVRHVMESLSLYVVVAALGVSGTASAAETPIEQAQFSNWTGQKHQAIVADGSVLTEYQGITEAGNRPGMRLQVRFSPRFSCTPMISITVPDAGFDLGSANAVDENGSSVDDVVSVNADGQSGLPVDTDTIPEYIDDDSLEFRIDGSAVSYPLIVDTDDGTVWHFNGDERARETLRLQMDIGDRATITVGEDRELVFSLLGSRKTLKALQSLCRQHDPIPYDN